MRGFYFLQKQKVAKAFKILLCRIDGGFCIFCVRDSVILQNLMRIFC